MGLDATTKLSSKLGLSGEYWTGQNLADVRGGIGQGVNTVTGAEIRSHGGWIELGYQSSLKYKFAVGYTAEAPEVTDISTKGRIGNSAVYLHNRYKLTNNLDLGASYLFWSTRYLDQPMGVDNRFQLFVQHNF